MATINKTFSVKTGIDVANTIVLDSNRNLSNINTANIVSTLNVGGNDIYAVVNSAANTVSTSNNGTLVLANASQNFNSSGTINVAILANGTNQVNISFSTNATSLGIASLNSAVASLNSAVASVNTALASDNAAFVSVNTALTNINTALGTINTNVAIASTEVSTYANGTLVLASANLNFNNTATVNVSVTANGTGQANVAFVANTTALGGPAVNAALASINTALTSVNTALASDNSAFASINSALATINTEFLPLTGGSLSGSLSIAGNLVVVGNTVTLNVGSIKSNDSIIYLASNNTSDVVTLGVVGNTNDALLGQQQTGLIRNPTDNAWYLFEGFAGANIAYGPTLNVAQTNVATLVANVKAQNILLGGNLVATTSNLTLAYNQANSAYGQANLAYTRANQSVEAITSGNTSNLVISGNSTNVVIDLSVAGLTVSGNINVYSVNVSNSITVGPGSLNVFSGNATSSGTGQVVLDQFATSLFASAIYQIEQNYTGAIHVTQIQIVQDTTNVYIDEFGTVLTQGNLGSFTGTITGGQFQLLWTPANTGTNIRFARHALPL